jgi:MYXO-CTERM domain-containing protein
MKSYSTAMLMATALIAQLASFNALASDPNPAPGPGIFALLALGVVGAIGISRLRK